MNTLQAIGETAEAVRLAHRVLDKPYIDPDGDIALLARQFLRQLDVAQNYRALRSCARMRVMGYAGNIRPTDTASKNAPGHYHAGFEFWSYDPYPDQPEAKTSPLSLEVFDCFVAKLRELSDLPATPPRIEDAT